MKNIYQTTLFLLTLCLFISLNSYSQITFQRTYGYSLMDMYSNVQQTNDLGFIMSGTSIDGINFTGSIIKTQPNGDLSWGKNFNGVIIDLPFPFGTYDDDCSFMINYIKQTSDNGYILTGQISPALGSLYVDYTDAVLIKLNSGGVVSWTTHYGGSESDIGNFVMQTSDGGYLVTGSTKSFSAKDSLNIYIFKTNSTGVLTWEKTVQVSTVDDDVSVTAEEVSDGYIIGGYTEQINGGDTLSDMVLIKTNKTTGAVSWLKTYGANNQDEKIFDVTLSTANNLLVTGYTNQSGYNNTLLMKTDISNGNIISSTSYFSGLLSLADEGHSIQNTGDGGISIIGFSIGLFGANSILLKTDASGNTVTFCKAYNNGFSGMQFFSSGHQTGDGGYIIGNMGPGAVAWDFGLIKTDAVGISGCNEDNATPSQEACSFTPETPAYTTYTGTASENIDVIISDITITDGTLCCSPLPDDAGTITGQTTVCQGQTGLVYSVPAIANATGYNWTLPAGASIVNGSNTNTITVNFSTGATSGSITVTGTNQCGTGSTASLNITVNSIPSDAGIITGTSSVCQGQTGVTFSVPGISGAVSYQWSVPSGASIAGGSGTNTITVDFSASAVSGNITVYGTNLCGNGNTSSFAVTVATLPSAAGAISGTDTVCQGASGVIYSVPPISGATDYIWTVPVGAVISSGINTNSITVDYSGTAVSGTISVYGTNNCGNGTSASFQITVNSLPGTPSGITGDSTVCQTDTGIVYSISTLSGATGYVWTVPSGATISSGQNTNIITVDYSNTAVSGNITVYGSNSCGNGISFSYPVTVSFLPGAAGIISGADTVCQSQTTVLYSISEITGATSYFWSLPSGATIISGSGTDSITVNFSSTASSGNISVYASNFCGNGDSSFIPVFISPLPDTAGIISGTATVCQGDTNISFNILSIAEATGYIWTLPDGAVITSGDSTNSITVDFSNTAISGNITVAGINQCGSGISSSFPITVNILPQTPSAISGNNQVCQTDSGIIYSVSITGATGYSWNVPAGAVITNGNNTDSITVQFSDSAISGNISVYGTNLCGNGDTAIFPVTVSTLPGAAGIIIGTTTLCQGETGITYSVPAIPGATGYQWIVPSGVTITSGSGTNSITVNFSSVADSGIISVSGINFCGTGDTSAKAINVNPLPLFTISKTDIKCYGDTNGKAWVVVLNAVQPVGFSWSNGSVNDTITGLSQDTYILTVTNGNGCQSANTINIFEPAQLSISITGDSTSCFNTNDGSALAVITGGTTPYSYTWSDINTTQTPNVTGLSQGIWYYLVMIDKNLCMKEDSIMIFAPSEITAGITETTPATCYDGQNGTALLWSSGGTGIYTYSWNGLPGITGPSGTGLAAGIYQVTVTDANACDKIVSVTIGQPPLINVNYLTDSTSCIDANDGEILIYVSGGSPPFLFNWTGTSISDSIKTGLHGGTYVVTITDSHQCTETETITVPASPDICLEIPTAYTPNGDGNNDTWEIKGIEFYPLVQVEIYNRWGQLMFESKGYITQWDGKYKGNEAPSGPYIFIINLNNGSEPIQGTVTIIR